MFNVWSCFVFLILILTLNKIVEIDPEAEAQIMELMLKTPTDWVCGHLQCDYSAVKKQDLRRHIESKHVDIGGVQCDHCDQVCTTRRALTRHVRKYHRV